MREKRGELVALATGWQGRALKAETEVERIAHAACDALRELEDEADPDFGGNPHFASTARAILRGGLIGTEHEGHRG